MGSLIKGRETTQVQQRRRNHVWKVDYKAAGYTKRRNIRRASNGDFDDNGNETKLTEMMA